MITRTFSTNWLGEQPAVGELIRMWSFGWCRVLDVGPTHLTVRKLGRLASAWHSFRRWVSP